jgi:hypothetical protein
MYDAMLLVLTVRGCTRGLGRRAPLLALLFRDGLWAFLAVFGARLALSARGVADPRTAGTFVLQAVFFGVIRGPLASAAWSCVPPPTRA